MQLLPAPGSGDGWMYRSHETKLPVREVKARYSAGDFRYWAETSIGPGADESLVGSAGGRRRFTAEESKGYLTINANYHGQLASMIGVDADAEWRYIARIKRISDGSEQWVKVLDERSAKGGRDDGDQDEVKGTINQTFTIDNLVPGAQYHFEIETRCTATAFFSLAYTGCRLKSETIDLFIEYDN